MFQSKTARLIATNKIIVVTKLANLRWFSYDDNCDYAANELQNEDGTDFTIE